MPSELLCVEDLLAQMSVAEQDEALAEARGASPLEDSVSERQAAAPVIVAPLPTPAEEAIAIAKVLREMLEDNSVSASHKAEFSEWAMEQLHLRQLHLPPGLRTAHVMNVFALLALQTFCLRLQVSSAPSATSLPWARGWRPTARGWRPCTQNSESRMALKPFTTQG